MPKGRGGALFVIILIVLVAVAFLYLRRSGDGTRFLGASSDKPLIPLDLQMLIPPDWEVQRTPQVECDFDGDGIAERLVIYRYDDTTLPLPLAAEGSTDRVAPFGGVIFDTQGDPLPERPDGPGPYRASNIVPYRLLPDFYPGKGQGFLGETAVEVRYSPALKTGTDCQVAEISVFGFTGTDLPTRLSIFRWSDKTAGYQGPHFSGNARIDSNVLPEGGEPITKVNTYNRLLNHRSLLCDVDGYIRPNKDVLQFIPDAAAKTIDFCFGTPDDPVYPEAVVVALTRGKDPIGGEPPRYLLDNATIAPELAFLKQPDRTPMRLVSLGNPSTVTPDQTRGAWCNTDQINTADKETLWCGRERVQVHSRVVLSGVVRDAVWTLISVAADRPDAEIYWRVEEVELS